MVACPTHGKRILDRHRAGLDIISGLHTFLGDDPEFAAAAPPAGVTIDYGRRPTGHETAVGRATPRASGSS